MLFFAFYNWIESVDFISTMIALKILGLYLQFRLYDIQPVLDIMLLNGFSLSIFRQILVKWY